MVIKSIKFELIDKEFNLKNFSVFFTIICIYIFINACNMYDGADLQLGIYFLVFILIEVFNSFNLFFLLYS